MQPDLEPLVDPDALRRYLDGRLPQGAGRKLRVERVVAGHSNETFFVTAGGSELVLRRPPRGAFLPTAHDVVREHRILSALAGTGVRAPRPLLLCEDPSVIGAPFYLMERIHGVVIRSSLPGAFQRDVAARAGIGDELVDALAELHALDWRDLGLEGFGRPDGYLERQLRRWSGQLELTEPLTRPVPELHRVADWLTSHLPPPAHATVVHGDYKLDNVAFAREAPARLVAIFDWEMSTIGDPLADLGWLLSFWREPRDRLDLPLDRQTVTWFPGFRTRAELLERYASRTGRPVEEGAVRFYLVLAVWKLAILLDGSYARHLAGVTDDPLFGELRGGVPALARRALELTSEAV